MAKYAPDKRTANHASGMATSAVMTGAATNATSGATPACNTNSAAAYAPSPKYAAWPNECMPAGPMMKCKLAANSAATSTSTANTNT